MFERFTERARQVVVLAQEECRSHKDDQIVSTHILLGLMREEEGLAAQVLKSLGLRIDDLRSELPPSLNHEAQYGQIPFTENAKKTLELALRQALSLGHNYIGTEHILLGFCAGSVACEPYLVKKLGKNWRETIELDVIEVLRGPEVKEEVDVTVTDDGPDEISIAKKEALDYKDLLDDILRGFVMWRDRKTAEATLSDEDESLCRWIEATKASDYL